MTWFDFGVLSVLVVSVTISLFHGLAREMVSLGVWVGGFILSTLFGGQVTGLLPQSLSPLLSALMGFLIVFGVVLMVGWIVGLALSSAVRASGLGPADRALGSVFGLVSNVLLHELIDHLDHFCEVCRFGCSRKMICLLDAQRFDVLKKGLLKLRGKLG